MTTILYHENRLYADSATYKDGVRFDCLDKIKGILRPLRISSKLDDFDFEDTVYGYAGTGSLESMACFVDHLTKSFDETNSSEMAINFYDTAAVSFMASPNSHFEILLLSLSKVHSFRFDYRGFVYRTYTKGNTVALGTGGEAVIEFMRYHHDPLRAMMETFVIDAKSGGFIDCWELEEVEGIPMLQRVGFREPIPRTYIRTYLERYPDPLKHPVPLTFIYGKPLQDALGKLTEENQQLALHVARLKEQVAKPKKKK